MSRSGILSVLFLVPLVLAGPADAASISFVDLVNPVGHVYHVSDTVQIGVYIDSALSPIILYRFHLTDEPELSLTLPPQNIPPPGWTLFSTGGVCDLLDPLGHCIASEDPTLTGSVVVQQVGILTYEVVAVGSGEATVGPLFASGDGIEDSLGFDITASFEVLPATILVPEPATLGPLGLGLAWLAHARRRRVRAAAV